MAKKGKGKKRGTKKGGKKYRRSASSRAPLRRLFMRLAQTQVPARLPWELRTPWENGLCLSSGGRGGTCRRRERVVKRWVPVSFAGRDAYRCRFRFGPAYAAHRLTDRRDIQVEISNKDRKVQMRVEYHLKGWGKRLPKSLRAERAKVAQARNEANRARNATPVRLLNWPA